MLKRLLVASTVATLAVAMGYAGQSQAFVTTSTNAPTPSNKISPSNGNGMFSKNCAPCHGADGKGHGPVPTSRNSTVADLTLLAKNNHGNFPEEHVRSVLRYGSRIPSHTSVEMPVWGPILDRINRKDPKEGQVRINSLTHYLETIQVK